MAKLAEAREAPEITEFVFDLKPSELASELTAIYTRPIVALIARVSSTKVVAGWEKGDEIAPKRDQGLRLALQTACIIKTRFDDAVVRAWIVGMNARLDDRAPGEIIGEIISGTSPATRGRDILAAARAFVNR